MKYNNYRIILACTTVAVFLSVIWAHDNEYVHPTLTAFAFDAWNASSSDGSADPFSAWGFSNNSTATFNYNSTNRTIGNFDHDNPSMTGWLAQGSIDEDDIPRFSNHFYNPIGSTARLTDGVNPLQLLYLESCSDSYTWAISGTGTGSPNYETWPLTRSYAFIALTATTSSVRNEAFAHTFYALGKIIHLVQDLSQPDHARNDTHPITMWRWIENYGLDAIRFLNNPVHKSLGDKLAAATPLNWRDAGFTKLKDFWTRGYYTGGNSTALDDDASGDITKTLGMAEFSNGNFLGEDATYPEWLNSVLSNKRFPFPNLRSTTDGTLPTTVSDTSNAINNAHIKSMLDQNGHTIGNGLYLEKVKDGIHVDYHSAVLYSLVHNRNATGPYPTLAVQSHRPGTAALAARRQPDRS